MFPTNSYHLEEIMQKISVGMIRKIHTLRKTLHIDDDSYYSELERNCGVQSTKDLSYEDAKQVIESLEAVALRKGVWEKRENKKERYTNYDNRPDMATSRQMRKIEAMWSEISFYRDDVELSKKALSKFLHNRFQVSALEWLPEDQVRKVVAALTAMKKNKKKAS